jgi:hypothetical protein
MTGTHSDTKKAMRRRRFASKFAPQWGSHLVPTNR